MHWDTDAVTLSSVFIVCQSHWKEERTRRAFISFYRDAVSEMLLIWIRCTCRQDCVIGSYFHLFGCKWKTAGVSLSFCKDASTKGEIMTRTITEHPIWQSKAMFMAHSHNQFKIFSSVLGYPSILWAQVWGGPLCLPQWKLHFKRLALRWPEGLWGWSWWVPVW